MTTYKKILDETIESGFDLRMFGCGDYAWGRVEGV